MHIPTTSKPNPKCLKHREIRWDSNGKCSIKKWYTIKKVLFIRIKVFITFWLKLEFVILYCICGCSLVIFMLVSCIYFPRLISHCYCLMRQLSVSDFWSHDYFINFSSQPHWIVHLWSHDYFINFSWQPHWIVCYNFDDTERGCNNASEGKYFGPIHVSWLHWLRKIHLYCYANTRIFEDGCLLGCCAENSGRSLPTFQRCLLLPSSWPWSPWWWRQQAALKRR
jgi:hypothetical protein